MLNTTHDTFDGYYVRSSDCCLALLVFSSNYSAEITYKNNQYCYSSNNRMKNFESWIVFNIGFIFLVFFIFQIPNWLCLLKILLFETYILINKYK